MLCRISRPNSVLAAISFAAVIVAGALWPGATASAQAVAYGMVTQELSPTEADTVSRIGAGWVLLNFNWDQVDRGCSSRADLPGCRDYLSLDAMVDQARHRGLRVVGDLSYTAAWASATGMKQSPAADPQDYSDYLVDIVKRYSKWVSVWKIWNEPNLPAFLTPADQWMALYKQTVLTATAAIKRADSGAQIIGPDLSYHALAGGSMSPFNQIMADYGWRTFDIISIHHYDDDGVPLGVRLDEGVAPFRRGKPVWVTETGQRWSTFSQTFATQQVFYLRALADCDDRRDWVTNIFFYDLVGDDLFNVTADGSYETAFPALRSYETWIRAGRSAAFALAAIPARDPRLGAIDPSEWSIAVRGGPSDPSIPVAQFGRQIHVGPLLVGAGGTHAGGVVSAQTYDLTGAVASVRMLTPPALEGGAYASWTVATDSSNLYRVVVQGGQLSFEKTVRGETTTLVRLPFSLIDTAYVRVRHDPVDDRIVFETMSADRAVVTPRAAAAHEFDIRTVRMALEAGTSAVESTAPGTVVFDRAMVSSLDATTSAR
jgi:hypothetical protein